jgi:hypothetical protein
VGFGWKVLKVFLLGGVWIGFVGWRFRMKDGVIEFFALGNREWL